MGQVNVPRAIGGCEGEVPISAVRSYNKSELFLEFNYGELKANALYLLFARFARDGYGTYAVSGTFTLYQGGVDAISAGRGAYAGNGMTGAAVLSCVKDFYYSLPNWAEPAVTHRFAINPSNNGFRIVSENMRPFDAATYTWELLDGWVQPYEIKL